MFAEVNLQSAFREDLTILMIFAMKEKLTVLTHAMYWWLFIPVQHKTFLFCGPGSFMFSFQNILPQISSMYHGKRIILLKIVTSKDTVNSVFFI